MAASLREGLEEMRLNPFGVEFLGALPSQRLVMFKREIYPAGWLDSEIKSAFSPIGRLRRSYTYHCERYWIQTAMPDTNSILKPKAVDIAHEKEFPCFLHHGNGTTEVLWGATYRITMVFLKLVFGFTPPDPGDITKGAGDFEGELF